MGGKSIEPEEINQVYPRIWIGPAVRYVPPKITAIVNLTQVTDTAHQVPGGLYTRVMFAPIEDGFYIYPMKWLDSTVDTIKAWLEEGLNILVHCTAGISRSAFVVAAFLLKHANMSVDAAMNQICLSRPQCNPNRSFMDTLKKYRERLDRC